MRFRDRERPAIHWKVSHAYITQPKSILTSGQLFTIVCLPVSLSNRGIDCLSRTSSLSVPTIRPLVPGISPYQFKIQNLTTYSYTSQKLVVLFKMLLNKVVEFYYTVSWVYHVVSPYSRLIVSPSSFLFFFVFLIVDHVSIYFFFLFKVMKTRNLSPSEAIRFIKQRMSYKLFLFSINSSLSNRDIDYYYYLAGRPQAQPNYGFIKQLDVFEKCGYEPSLSHPQYRSWKRRHAQDVNNYLNHLVDTVAIVPDKLLMTRFVLLFKSSLIHSVFFFFLIIITRLACFI